MRKVTKLGASHDGRGGLLCESSVRVCPYFIVEDEAVERRDQGEAERGSSAEPSLMLGPSSLRELRACLGFFRAAIWAAPGKGGTKDTVSIHCL